MRSKRAWESEGTCTSSIFSSEPTRSLSPCRNLYKHAPRLTRLGRAMFADTVESELVRGDFESVVGELFVNDEFLQISIDGSQANIGKLLSDPVINLIRRGMGAVVLNSIPDNFQL